MKILKDLVITNPFKTLTLISFVTGLDSWQRAIKAGELQQEKLKILERSEHLAAQEEKLYATGLQIKSKLGLLKDLSVDIKNSIQGLRAQTIDNFNQLARINTKLQNLQNLSAEELNNSETRSKILDLLQEKNRLLEKMADQNGVNELANKLDLYAKSIGGSETNKVPKADSDKLLNDSDIDPES